MGKKLYSIVLTFLLFAAFGAASVRAQTIAGSSAAVAYIEKNSITTVSLQKNTLKRKAITEVLKRYNSPLLAEVDSFLDACTTYDLDCYLLPSIAGVESTFGRFMAQGTNNPFGWGRGLLAFPSFSHTIMAVGKGLKENYIDKGADTVDKIGRIYCEGDTWPSKVTFFMNQFEEEEKKQLFFMQDTVQL